MSGQLFVFLFAAAFLVLLPMVVGGMIYFTMQRGKRLRRSWEMASGLLGLTLAPAPKLELKGRYNGYEIVTGAAVRRNGDSTDSFSYCNCKLNRKLLLALRLSAPHNFISDLINSSGDIRIGVGVFDKKFKAGCYDAGVLRDLLLRDLPSAETRNLAEDLILAQQAYPRIDITDEHIYVETRGHLANTAQIRALSDAATRLARRVEEARSRVPQVEWERNLFADWTTFADSYGLRFDRDNVIIKGNYKSLGMEISVETARGRWQTRIHAGFPRELQSGLRLQPEGSLHRAFEWLGAQDIKTGHEEFDELFVVKANDVGAALGALRPDVCAYLVQIRRGCADLKLDPTGIEVLYDTVVGDATALRQIVESVAFAASAFTMR